MNCPFLCFHEKVILWMKLNPNFYSDHFPFQAPSSHLWQFHHETATPPVMVGRSNWPIEYTGFRKNYFLQ
jgi:hypothetical protein